VPQAVSGHEEELADGFDEMRLASFARSQGRDGVELERARGEIEYAG
jgi:hypothetical protein